MASKRAHLFVGDEPIHEGGSLIVLCELPINRTKIVAMWDEVEIGFAEEPLWRIAGSLCKDCFKELRKHTNRAYIYGVKESSDES